jgi:hypothetical protein
MKKIRFFMLTAAVLFLVPALAACTAEPYTAKTYDAAAGISDLTIEVRDRAVEVVMTDDETVRVEYYANSKEDYSFEEKDGVLTMKAVSNKDWTDYIGVNGNREQQIIRVYLPRGIRNLSLVTTNRDVSLSEIDVAGSCSLDVNNGNISFETLSVGSALSVKVKNGNVAGTLIGSYDVFDMNISVSKGDSNLPARKEGGEKQLTADVNNGDLTIELTPAA